MDPISCSSHKLIIVNLPVIIDVYVLHDFIPVQFCSKPRHQTRRHFLEALNDFLLGEVAVLGLVELRKYSTEAPLFLFIFLCAC